VTLDERFDSLIARRNRAWVRWRNALEEWLRAGSPTGPLLAAVNDAQYAYEWACRDLTHEKIARRRESRVRAA
jgi:hypothetical protein